MVLGRQAWHTPADVAGTCLTRPFHANGTLSNVRRSFISVAFHQCSSLWRGLLVGAEIVSWLVLRLRHVHARHTRAFGHLRTHTELFPRCSEYGITTTYWGNSVYTCTEYEMTRTTCLEWCLKLRGPASSCPFWEPQTPFSRKSDLSQV